MIEPRKVAKGDRYGMKELLWWTEEVGRLIDDPEALAQAVEVQEALDRVIRESARRLNREGFSWTVIGRVFGVSDVAALKRFRRTGGAAASRKAAS